MSKNVCESLKISNVSSVYYLYKACSKSIYNLQKVLSKINTLNTAKYIKSI